EGSVEAVNPETKSQAVQPDPDDSGFRENWPRFRGATGLGIVDAGEWTRTWDAETGENILWKTRVDAPGNSSPVIWGDRIFLTGADADSEKQEVLCFERETGELLWRSAVEHPRNTEAGDGERLDVFEQTGYAAPSPSTDGAKVYVTYASADVAAVDFEGEVVWVRNLGDPENMYGRATSLLVYKDVVLVQFDRGITPDDASSELIALDTRTGETTWSRPRPVRSSWSTPIVVATPSGPQLITSSSPYVISYDPDSG
ncbi:unnamed protein product, partial [marine sediment metagenome]